MKNIFKVLALSFAVVALASACNNKPAEVEEDTTATDTIMVEDMTMDVVAEDLAPVEEEVVATKPAKKAEKKINETTVTLDNGATATTANSGKMKKANGALDNESSKTTKDGSTVTTNNAGKMKKKASND
ncbi:MAG: hypothetical protein IKX32_03000 [Bacteroidales bacterium]|nr:hypothetical protein [Bacteroidales bacterium]